MRDRSTIKAVTRRILQDYSTQSGPFTDGQLPEVSRGLDVIPDEVNDLHFITYGVMLDYNRTAATLWDNMIRIAEQEPWMFDPSRVVDHDRDEVKQVLQRIQTRYYNRDADIWYDNSQILVDRYVGSVHSFVADCDFDATELFNRLQEDEFSFLKGDKLGPFWIKLVNEHFYPLKNMNDLQIPVDTHVRNVTKYLTKTNLSDDDVRRFWNKTVPCPYLIDTPLWIIGNNWDDWGKDYLDEVIEDADS